MDPHFLLLQINDSLFPIGAYSHSWGLETYIQKDLVRNAEDAAHYIERYLTNSFLHSDLLAASLSHRAASEEDLEQILRIEEIYLASRVPSEVRSASEKLGNRFIHILQTFPDFQQSEFFRRYREEHEDGADRRPFCHPAAYGMVTALAKIPEEEALANFLYTQSSLMVTTCVKTIPISQTDGQKILFSLHPLFDRMLSEVQGLTEDDLCLSAPGFDLRCIQHEKLYSRLYMS